MTDIIWDMALAKTNGACSLGSRFLNSLNFYVNSLELRWSFQLFFTVHAKINGNYRDPSR